MVPTSLHPSATVARVDTEADLADFIDLFDAYARWVEQNVHTTIYHAQTHATDERNDPKRFYAPPGGLLLARIDGRAAGITAVRSLDAHTAEISRCYVRPDQHGHGIGRRLLHTAIELAQAGGHRTITLDTLPEAMPAAAELYRRVGFTRVGSRAVPGVPYAVDTLTLRVPAPSDPSNPVETVGADSTEREHDANTALATRQARR